MGKGIFIALLAVSLLTGFSPAPEIIDLRNISQDHHVFTGRQEQEFRLLDQELQKKAAAFHNATFFSPWHQYESRFSRDDVKYEFDKYGKGQGYGRKGKRHPRAWIKKLLLNARLQDYPLEGYPAITVRNTDLRVLPTIDAFLRDSEDCGLPFDNLQNSGVAADTPIYVSHVTKDKNWVLAETHYAQGWVPARHIARVDGDFMKRWENSSYVAIIRDKTSVYDEVGKLLFKAPLGSFFPKVGEDADAFQILIAVADRRGQAAWKKVRLVKESAVAKPLALTAANMARIANELMGNPYGWGGLDQKRDCSSTLMDLFSPFGIWLPRNSGHQAQKTGVFIDLSNLSPEEKEKAILKQGMPYLTLLWLKGHIMLYIGEQEGRALVFHNFWKVKTMDAKGRQSKRIVGRAAITTLNPGQELRQGNGPGDMLPAILGMTLLWPPPVEEANISQGQEYYKEPASLPPGS